MASDGPGNGPSFAPVDRAQADHLHLYAHDLKNRVAGLLEVLRQLRSPDRVDGQQELFDFGERQSFAILRRTEELLDVLGVPRGASTPHLVAVDLFEVLRSGLDRQRYRFEQKGQQVSMEPKEPLFVLADQRHTETIVEALLSNASKFSPPGSPITVHLRRSDDRGVLEVRDEGVGLTAIDLEQIFVRYAWLSSSSTAGEAQGRSTLARCAQIAKVLGGDLTAESEGQGTGARFLLGLPLADKQA